MIFHYSTFILISKIIFCLFSEDIYLSFGLSLSNCEFFVSLQLSLSYFGVNLLRLLLIFLAILLPFKPPIISVVLWISLFEKVLSEFVADCLAWWRGFWHVANILGLYSLLNFFSYIVTNVFAHIFSKSRKSITFYKNSMFSLMWILHHFLYFTL